MLGVEPWRREREKEKNKKEGKPAKDKGSSAEKKRVLPRKQKEVGQVARGRDGQGGGLGARCLDCGDYVLCVHVSYVYKV